MPSSRSRPKTTRPKKSAKARRRKPSERGSPARAPRNALPSDLVDFAHESERQYARLLDFYQIDWAYEPTTFDIEWDDDGRVTKRFSPDFYLPDFDLYIEVTTMNQKLVTKKNRKVRRLRELHPEVNVKIFYQRDYVALLQKYGLEPSEERT